jgi:two-component system chemotaxis sensor kinase CheA
VSTDEDDLKRIFFLECDELLASAEQSVESLRSESAPEEAINALFRSVHSIKGGAGAFGMDLLAKFAHAFESFMDLLRKARAELNEDSLDLLFDGVDVLRILVEESQHGTPAPSARFDAALAGLRRAAGLDNEPEAEVAPEATPPEAPFVEATADVPTRQYRIRFAPGPRMLSAGIDPLRILRAIKALGSASVEADVSRLPSLADLDPAVCHIAWTAMLESSRPRADLDEIGEMIDDLATLAIETSAESEPAPAPAAKPNPVEKTVPTVAGAAKSPVRAPQEPPAGAPPTRRDKPVATVRVDVPKLERLGNMVGELIITQAFLARQAADLNPDQYRNLFRALDEMSQHIRDLADAATSIRAQPLKVVFSRFGALVRDLEKATSKRVRLEIHGESTEIDKTVVERLSEPLTHLIRNSIDHGIESTDDRVAAGKDPVGRLRLSAEQRGSQVVIELSDDGAGVNRERVLRKAIERGMVAADASLSDEEIDGLIFLPGFSTAESVTSISGRGVGMDAVRETIAEMGGQVGLVSQPGLGATFSLYLPLSLAILDAMVTVVARHNYLIPISTIVDSLRPSAASIVQMDQQNLMLAWRGTMLRILSLAKEFSIQGAIGDPTQCILVVVRPAGGEMLALQVDDLIGQEPVVVKSLEKNYRKVPGLSGATILGDGRPALILDPPSLASTVAGRRTFDTLAPVEAG